MSLGVRLGALSITPDTRLAGVFNPRQRFEKRWGRERGVSILNGLSGQPGTFLGTLATYYTCLDLLLVIVDGKRSVESPDRADALIGAVMMGIGSDPCAVNPGAREQMLAAMQQASQ